MTGPVLLTYFNGLAKSAHETGDTRSYVEQTLAFSKIKGLHFRLSERLSRRLIAAEDRYRDNVAPFLTDTNVAAAFNALRSSLANSTDYPTIAAKEVHKLRQFLSRFSPDLFLVEKTNYSPIEAIVLLFLIAHNNGRIDLSDIEAIEAESAVIQGSHSGVLIAGVFKKSSTPTVVESLLSQLRGMSQPQLERWSEDILNQLNI